MPHSTIHYISAEVSHTVRHATPVQRFPYCTIHYIRAEVSHTVRYTLSVQCSERFPTDRDTMHGISVRRFPYRHCTTHYTSVVLFPHRYKYDPLRQCNFSQPAYDTLRECRGFPHWTIHYISAEFPTDINTIHYINVVRFPKRNTQIR